MKTRQGVFSFESDNLNRGSQNSQGGVPHPRIPTKARSSIARYTVGVTITPFKVSEMYNDPIFTHEVIEKEL